MGTISVEQLREEVGLARSRVASLELTLLRELGWGQTQTIKGEWRWCHPDVQGGGGVMREAAVAIAMGERDCS